MSENRLTIDDFKTIISVLEGQIEGALNPETVAHLKPLRDKCVQTVQNTQRVRAAEQHARLNRQADAINPSTIEKDDAQSMSDRGEQLMVRAVPARIPEGPHHRLCCLQVGLVTALHKSNVVQRTVLATDMASNLLLTAIKAAYMEGGGPTLQSEDDGS